MSSRLFSRERKTSLLRRFSLFSLGLTYTAGDLRLINLLDLIYLPLLSSFPLSALPHRGGTLPQPLGSFTAATSTGSSEAEIEERARLSKAIMVTEERSGASHGGPQPLL